MPRKKGERIYGPVNVDEINPATQYPLRDTCHYLGFGYDEGRKKIANGTFPIRFKRVHSRLIRCSGRDIIKELEGGDWVEPKEKKFVDVA